MTPGQRASSEPPPHRTIHELEEQAALLQSLPLVLLELPVAAWLRHADNTRFLWSLPRVFRGLAQAEPGMKLVVADYKSAEIMVAACLMDDDKMISA